MSNAPAPKKAFIVSHTHWDREWYLTYRQFQVDLASVVRKVLDALEGTSPFRHFVLDGQSIVLEDYMEAHPEDAARVGKLVRQGSLDLGPWYILPDELLVSGESTLRNLLIGHKVAAAYGPVQKVGYMPDSFGHIAQMPQVLRLAGIDSFIYTRGNGDEIDDLGLEYIWRAPDGSKVLAVNQLASYCNAAGLGFEELWHAHTQRKVIPRLAVDRVRELFEKMASHSNGDIYLLNNGCDHFPPQQEFGSVLEALQEAWPGTRFLHTGFEDYVTEVMEAGSAVKEFEGELTSGKLHPILSGVWSSRIYLKQQNDRAQSLLSHYVEPMAAYGHFALGHPYPAGLIETAWKLLLKNHPHDSICGCSTDEVHRDMEPRFLGVIHTAEQLLRRQMRDLVPSFGRVPESDRQTVICVANPLPGNRSEVVQRVVVLQPFGMDVDRLRLFDAAGRQVPFVITRRNRIKRFWAVDHRTELFPQRQTETFQAYLDDLGDEITGDEKDDEYLTLRFLAEDLPALGHAAFFLREADAESPAVPAPVVVSGHVLENQFCRVEVHPNGTFDLLHKETGRHLPGLNLLEDTEDVGDEYDYSPCESSETVTTRECTGEVRTVENCGLYAELAVEYSLPLPRSINRDRKSRSDRRVPCSVRTRIGLKSGSRLVEVETGFDNRAKDHRLRAVFPTGLKSETIASDGHFYINRRSIQQPTGDGWVQPPAGTFPQQDYSLIQDDRQGLAVMNQGLPEIAASRDRSGAVTLYLTLLRCVGWLSRGDFKTRNHTHAGPMIRTPEAQCLGKQRFRYAVAAFSGDDIGADVHGLARRYKTPVPAVQGVADGHVPGTKSFLRKRTNSTAISAIKKHETRDTLILRLWNLTSVAVDETLTFHGEVRRAWRTDLLEKRSGEIGRRLGKELTVPLKPFQILILEIEFAGPSARC